jgi:hypothetical protein
LSLLCVVLGLAAPARAEQSFEFASASEGRTLLTARDAYVERMSPFDRAFRLRADRDVSEREYLAVIGQSVLEWGSAERREVQCALQRIRPALSRLFSPLRGPIYLVKTTGRGELAPYTRGNAIVLPSSALLASGKFYLRWLLAHESFHIYSRNDPKLRGALYEAIGFRHCGKVEVPAALRSRMLTNPDAPKNEHCIRVSFAGKPVWAVPIIHARKHDKASRRELIEFLEVSLLLVEKDALSGVARPVRGADGPSWVGVDRVTGFFEQVGRNTDYIIHPEEIVADNAALLTLRASQVRSPEILGRIAGVLGEARRGGPTPGQNRGKGPPAPKIDCAAPR